MPLPFLIVLLVCQLAGEIVSRGLGLPVPGPVIGMALLFLLLVIRGRVPGGLQTTATGLLGHLGLLFVPAGVGIMTHIPLLAAEWRPIAAALFGSTFLAILVTGLILQLLLPRKEREE
jgi:holin-like protein